MHLFSICRTRILFKRPSSLGGDDGGDGDGGDGGDGDGDGLLPHRHLSSAFAYGDDDGHIHVCVCCSTSSMLLLGLQTSSILWSRIQDYCRLDYAVSIDICHMNRHIDSVLL